MRMLIKQWIVLLFITSKFSIAKKGGLWGDRSLGMWAYPYYQQLGLQNILTYNKVSEIAMVYVRRYDPYIASMHQIAGSVLTFMNFYFLLCLEGAKKNSCLLASWTACTSVEAAHATGCGSRYSATHAMVRLTPLGAAHSMVRLTPWCDSRHGATLVLSRNIYFYSTRVFRMLCVN